MRPIIPYYQTLGVALVITPRQISRPPDAFIRRLRVTVMSDIIKVSPGTHRNKLVVLSSPALLYIRESTVSTSKLHLPACRGLAQQIQATVFNQREIGRYEAAEMREVCTM